MDTKSEITPQPTLNPIRKVGFSGDAIKDQLGTPPSTIPGLVATAGFSNPPATTETPTTPLPITPTPKESPAVPPVKPTSNPGLIAIIRQKLNI